jgi:hypothetical protein
MIERRKKALQDATRATSRRSIARGRARRRARGWLAAFLGLVLLGSSSVPAFAEEYDASSAGNPLRIVSYVVYPVGVIFDYLLLRPMYWVGSHEPFRSLFGRDDD